VTVRPRFLAAAVTVACLALAIGSAARADPVEDFYRGRRITLLIGYGGGSLYDLYARLLIRHLGRYIPGRPTLVPENMPGASSLSATNYLFNVARRDGAVIGAFHERMGLEPRIEPKGTRYDGRAFNWIGSMQRQVSVCVTWASTGVRTIEDMKRREVIAGGSDVAGSSAVFPRLMNNLLGTRIRLVTGYDASQVDLALERGEVESRCGAGWAGLKVQHPDWIAQRKIAIPVQFSLKSHPELPDVPTLYQLVSGPSDRQALEVMFATAEMGKPYAAPPGVPPERVAALRRAFDLAMEDASLIAEAAHDQLELGALSGSEIEAMLVRLYDLPDAIYQKLASWRAPPG
jgi:tripartite-type tricarboxylate transporter receptor subunit TctC